MAMALRIPPEKDSRWLGFDLREVMLAVGPHSNLRWYVRDVAFVGDLSSVWPDSREMVKARSLEGRGIPIDWATMARLAEAVSQTIDGQFVGYDANGKPQLSLQAIDSSYWIVWSVSTETMDSVRTAFPQAEDCFEPDPEDE